MRASNKYILAVDDDSDIARLVEQAFTDALMALEHFKAKSNDCGLISSDIRMPGMNGYEFVTHVKKINPKVKVILMSAFEIQDKEFHNVLSDIKVDRFLQKPFPLETLRNLVYEKFHRKNSSHKMGTIFF